MRSLPLSPALVLLAMRAVGAQAPSNTAMFRGGPEHRGVYASTNPSLATVVWKFRTNGKVFSTPLVVDSTVYVGSTDGNLYAIRAADGSVRWKLTTRGPFNSSPAYANGVVVASSVDGMVYAADAMTGAQRWTFATGGERRFTAPGIHGMMPRTEIMPDPFDVFLSSPVIVAGVVYVGSGDHSVYALDAGTGALKWKFTTGDVVHASPAVSNGVVYVGSWDRNFYAIDAATGKERWHYQTGNDTTIYNQIGIASSAAVADGSVFFGCRDGHFYALDARTGALRWSHDNHMGWVIASPAVRDGVVYFPTSDGTRFKALDAATGSVRFNVENKVQSFSSPAIVNDVIYYGTSDGWLHGIDQRTGASVAEFQTDGSKANASRYVDENGHLKAALLYDDRTLNGIVIGLSREYTLGSIMSSPVVANGVLYVGSTDGNVYALR